MSAASDDLLSALPDEILAQILSHLPPKTLACLAVLSRHFHRFYSLLPHLPLLLIDPADPLYPLPNALLHRLKIPHLGLLSLEQIRSILLSASDRGLRQLSLSNPSCPSEIPDNIFQTNSLHSLTANGCVFMNSIHTQFQIQCANLQTLQLHRCWIDSQIMWRLLASCRRLHTLQLVHCSGDGSVNIHSPSLQYLQLEPTMYAEGHGIHVRAPRLLTFTICTPPLLSFLVIETPKVEKAYLNSDHTERCCHELFRAFLSRANSLESLDLLGTSFQIFSKECANLQTLNASFDKLKTLTVNMDFTCEQQASCLVKLLHCCPRLVQLALSNEKVNYRRLTTIFEDFDDRMKPLASASHLADVEGCAFKADSNDLEFVRVLLTEAKSIKKMLQFPFHRRDAVKEMLSAMDHRPIES